MTRGRASSRKFFGLVVRSGVACSVILASSAAVTAEEKFTQEELKALPRVCHAQRSINNWLRVPIVPEAERRQWAERLGEKDYNHFHHYCGALIYVRRGSAAARESQRTAAYRRAVTSFEYVQINASASFPLMPEVGLRKGYALQLLRDPSAAAREFRTALELKPSFTPAYAALVDLYLELGDKESARRILEIGLRNVPDSKILAQKRAELEKAAPQSRR